MSGHTPWATIAAEMRADPRRRALLEAAREELLRSLPDLRVGPTEEEHDGALAPPPVEGLPGL